MGLWNLISGLALATGEMAGGFFLDLGKQFLRNPESAYALVFLTVALGLLGCLLLLRFIDVELYWQQISLRLGLKIPPEPGTKDHSFAPH